MLTGRDGKVLIDAGIPASRPQLTEALKSLGDDPIKHLINTHWHFDHTDGNEWLHSIGAEITAHENTRSIFPSPHELRTGISLSRQHRPVLCRQNYSTVNKLYISTEQHWHWSTIRRRTLTLIYLSTSQMLTSSMWPILFGTVISRSSITPLVAASTGRLRCSQANVARVTDKTIVIPGHGPIGNQSQLVGFRNMLVSVRDKVSALKNEGKSLEEVVAAKPTADYDAKWGGFVIDGNTFTALVYEGV